MTRMLCNADLPAVALAKEGFTLTTFLPAVALAKEGFTLTTFLPAVASRPRPRLPRLGGQERLRRVKAKEGFILTIFKKCSKNSSIS